MPPVAMGSHHLDTTAFGGRFDGILGMPSGLEVIRILQENGFKPKRPFEVINGAACICVWHLLRCRSVMNFQAADFTGAFGRAMVRQLGNSGRLLFAWFWLHLARKVGKED